MKVGIYARTAAGGRDTIGWQREAVRLAAEAYGDEVAAEFVDDGYSGMSLHRPGMAALRDGIEAGRIEAIWCLSPDRLSRDQSALVALLDELAHQQVPVRFVDTPGLDGRDARWLARLWATADGAQSLPSRPPRRHSPRLAQQGTNDGR